MDRLPAPRDFSGESQLYEVHTATLITIDYHPYNVLIIPQIVKPSQYYNIMSILLKLYLVLLILS